MATNFGYCRDCKWWGKDYDSTCERVDIDRKGTAEFSIFSRADDDQGLEARLTTGPDFGCVHFESNGKGGVEYVITAIGPFDDPDRL
jgi:hypothetical protein